MLQNAARPRLAYFALGGTIASAELPGRGAQVTLTGADLAAAVPGLAELAEMTVRSFRQLPSPDLTMLDMLAVRDEIHRSLDDGVDGIVISQGTDNLEETAYLLDLIIESDVPLVLTGAMRIPGAPGSDGVANLLGAIRVAVGRITAGIGAVVVFNDEIHAARFVKKRHTSATNSFGSPVGGPLGYISEGRPRLMLRPLGRLLVRLPDIPTPARVALATIGFDEDVTIVKAMGAECDGIVVAAFGGGHVPARIVGILDELNRRIPVVLASRTGAGAMLTHTYAFAGSEMDLLSRGLISAGALDAVHARILLRVLLMARAPRETIARSFLLALGGEGRNVIDAQL